MFKLEGAILGYMGVLASVMSTFTHICLALRCNVRLPMHCSFINGQVYTHVVCKLCRFFPLYTRPCNGKRNFRVCLCNCEGIRRFDAYTHQYLGEICRGKQIILEVILQKDRGEWSFILEASIVIAWFIIVMRDSAFVIRDSSAWWVILH